MATRRFRLGVLVTGAAALAACVQVLGLEDPRVRAPTDAGNGDAAAEGSTSDPSRPLPSWCDGISLYASFDSKLSGDRGGESTITAGGVTQTTQGRFGSAVSLIHDASSSTASAQGAALYFVATDAGNPWPENVGSLSVWYRQAPGTTWGDNPRAPVLYRPVASLPPAPVETSGLAFYLYDNDFTPAFGLAEQSGLDRRLVLSFAAHALTPYLRPNEYNHYFTAWRKAGTPSAYYAINGGLGVAFSDAGATTYADSGDGGEIRTPYRAFTSRPWTSEGPAVGLRMGGPGANTPDGTIDDLVVWNRVVSFEEAAAVYSANAPVGEICGLR